MASEVTVLAPSIDTLRDTLAEIEMGVLTEGYTLADAMREGSTVSKQMVGGWTDSNGAACALSAAYISAKARGII